MAAAKTYRYTVGGHGGFPLDMLRYDCCWPERGVDVVAIVDLTQNVTSMWHAVQLVSNKPPTEERWGSFGWRVETIEARRAAV